MIDEKKSADGMDYSSGNDDHKKPVMHPVDVDSLAERCLRLLKESESGNHTVSRCKEFNQFNQVFIGIAGTPGSG